MKSHRLGSLHNRHLFPYGLEARSPRSRCWQAALLLRPPSMACRRPSSCCVLTSALQSLCCLCPNLLILKDPGPIGLGPLQWPHVPLITSSKALSPNTAILWGPGVRTSTYKLEGHILPHNSVFVFKKKILQLQLKFLFPSHFLPLSSYVSIARD